MHINMMAREAAGHRRVAQTAGPPTPVAAGRFRISDPSKFIFIVSSETRNKP